MRMRFLWRNLSRDNVRGCQNDSPSLMNESPVLLLYYLKQLLAVLLHLHGAYLAGQSEQVDEAFRIVVVIHITCCEGSDTLII